MLQEYLMNQQAQAGAVSRGMAVQDAQARQFSLQSRLPPQLQTPVPPMNLGQPSGQEPRSVLAQTQAPQRQLLQSQPSSQGTQAPFASMQNQMGMITGQQQQDAMPVLSSAGDPNLKSGSAPSSSALGTNNPNMPLLQLWGTPGFQDLDPNTVSQFQTQFPFLHQPQLFPGRN